MRRPACTARNRAPGRRPSDTALPPLRADRANAPAKPRTPPSCATSEGIAQAGSGPINRRGGAPRGERPPAHELRKRVCAGTRGPTLLARSKRVPMHPSACRRSASLVLAREIGKARRTFCLARTMSSCMPVARMERSAMRVHVDSLPADIAALNPGYDHVAMRRRNETKAFAREIVDVAARVFR